MDKETLSNYGWVVILVLILAVLLALATPFGSFISTAIKSTTVGFYEVNQNSLNSTGLIQMADQSFDGQDTKAEPIVRSGQIPASAIYTTSSGTTLSGDNGDSFPNKPSNDDIYEEGDYKYTYKNNSWSVSVKDKTKTSYGEIISEIAGKELKNMHFAFQNCTSLKESPAMPDCVIDISGAFQGCISLIVAPKIPENITNMSNVFQNCASLTTAPDVPNGVIDMSSTFRGCTSLTKVPVIPNNITNMNATFFGCTSLTTAPIIPNKVADMTQTFQGCTSLTGTIEINATPSKYAQCFNRTTKPISLKGNSANLSDIAFTANNNNVTVNG